MTSNLICKSCRGLKQQTPVLLCRQNHRNGKGNLQLCVTGWGNSLMLCWGREVSGGPTGAHPVSPLTLPQGASKQPTRKALGLAAARQAHQPGDDHQELLGYNLYLGYKHTWKPRACCSSLFLHPGNILSKPPSNGKPAPHKAVADPTATHRPLTFEQNLPPEQIYGTQLTHKQAT